MFLVSLTYKLSTTKRYKYQRRTVTQQCITKKWICATDIPANTMTSKSIRILIITWILYKRTISYPDWRYVIVATAAIYILCGATTEINRNVRNNFCNNTCNNNICQGIAEATAVPNNDSCTEYFICSGGHPQPKACPNGQWFNSTASKCDSSENEKCNPKDEFKCPKEGIFFYPHEKFCDKFYMCFAGTAILRHCADGLYFSAESLQCDTPEKAECKLEKCPIDQEKFELIFLPSDVDCEK